MLKLEETKIIKCKKAIIANKNKDHFKYSEYLAKQGFNLLIEKPLFLNDKQFDKLNTLAKKKNLKFLLSLQYFFAFYLIYLKKKIENKKIKKIKFLWFDKTQEFRNNLFKKHDTSIDYTLDIFFHIYSILVSLGIKKKFSYFNKIEYLKNFEILLFGNKETAIEVKSSRKNQVRKRLIYIFLKNGSKIKINFSDNLHFNSKINNKIIKIPKIFIDSTLKYQIFLFLSQKKNGIKKNYNELKKLKSLFNYVNIINKKNEKNISLHSRSK